MATFCDETKRIFLWSCSSQCRLIDNHTLTQLQFDEIHSVCPDLFIVGTVLCATGIHSCVHVSQCCVCSWADEVHMWRMWVRIVMWLSSLALSRRYASLWQEQQTRKKFQETRHTCFCKELAYTGCIRKSDSFWNLKTILYATRRFHTDSHRAQCCLNSPRTRKFISHC
jgi:hypothetical protein